MVMMMIMTTWVEEEDKDDYGGVGMDIVGGEGDLRRGVIKVALGAGEEIMILDLETNVPVSPHPKQYFVA